MLRIVQGAVLLVCLAGQAAEAQRSLLPVDESASRPDFAAFRTRLMDAVARRDAAAILDIVHPDIKNGFGGNEGIEEFKEMWRLDQPDSEFWKEFGKVMTLGGVFEGAEYFTAPYTFSRWPYGVDSFDFVAVIGSNVRIRTMPMPDAPVLAQVSHLILELDPESLSKDWMTEEWTAVRVDGQKGYIATRFIRSPVDYRARFQFIDGRWRLIFFLAGD